MPWKRRNNNLVSLKVALLLAGLAAAAGVLACQLSSGAQKALSGFSEKASVQSAIAAELAKRGR